MGTINDYIKYHGKNTSEESGQKCPLNDLFIFMKHPLNDEPVKSQVSVTS
jgi:hypothetical protein